MSATRPTAYITARVTAATLASIRTWMTTNPHYSLSATAAALLARGLHELRSEDFERWMRSTVTAPAASDSGTQQGASEKVLVSSSGGEP